MTSGSRPWRDDGNNGSGREVSRTKRPRTDGSRDRRDMTPEKRRRESRERRDVDSYHDRDRSRYHSDSRRDSYHRERREDRDRLRDKERDRDRHREKVRERDRRRERDRDRDRHRRDEHRSRKGSPYRKTPIENGHHRPPKDDNEREEGEISGHSRSPSPSTSVSSRPPPTITCTEVKRSFEALTPVVPTTTNADPNREPEMELDLVTTPPPVETSLAARRARRQAIMAKFSGIASSGPGASPSPIIRAGSTDSGVGQSSANMLLPSFSTSSTDLPSQTQSAALTPREEHADERSAPLPDNGRLSPSAPSPLVDSFDIKDIGDIAKDGHDAADGQPDSSGEQISAADYDPSLDRREDEEKRVRGVIDKDAVHNGDGEVEMVEEEEEEDVEDMFALDQVEKKKKKTIRKVVKPVMPAVIATTLDSAADAEGYYQIILGEHLDGGRYQVFSSLGKGMFANVVRARVLQNEDGDPGQKEVAIKIVRCQESMYKAGLKEVQILNKLKQADPEDKKHVVRLERTFEHRGHLCLVFESLSMNLREVVKRFGKDVGLNIRAVRAYAHQLFLALSLLRKCNIMHADIKPDNILVNEQKTLLKLCDLGSASDVSENDITPYLVSRFYRAPEIILGVPYDCSLDIWSIGCTLYELYTGKILFPGRSNNQMLLLMMELKGRFNSKIVKKAKFGDVYFDELGAFESVEKDRVTGSDMIRKVHITKPTRDLRARILPSASKTNEEETKLIYSFIDLLDKCLMLDPARRITPKEALVHPFIRG